MKEMGNLTLRLPIFSEKSRAESENRGPFAWHKSYVNKNGGFLKNAAAAGIMAEDYTF